MSGPRTEGRFANIDGMIWASLSTLPNLLPSCLTSTEQNHEEKKKGERKKKERERKRNGPRGCACLTIHDALTSTSPHGPLSFLGHGLH